MHQSSNVGGAAVAVTPQLKTLLDFTVGFWQMIVTHFPGRLGRVLRYRFWSKRLNYLGSGVRIDTGTYFQNPEYISVDSNCWIDKGVMILAGPDRSQRSRRLIGNERFAHERGVVLVGQGVHIGPYCIISGIGGVQISAGCGLSSGVKIYSLSHHYRSDACPSNHGFRFSPLGAPSRQYLVEGPVFLDTNVGIALNAVILPGASIGKDSFVAINGVVKSSFGENSLIAGNPAKRVGTRFAGS